MTKIKWNKFPFLAQVVLIFLSCKTSQVVGGKPNANSSVILHESLLVPADKWKEIGCECGVQSKGIGFRKIDQFTFKRGELPWIVSISFVKKNQSYRDRVHLCSGSLINFLYVLTSAECVNGLPKNNFRVELMGLNVNSSKLIKIQSVKFHPLYRNGNDNGIALLKLVSYIKPSTNAVPICLPSVLNQNKDNLTMKGTTKDKAVQYKDVLIKRWVYRKSQDPDFPSTPIYAQTNVELMTSENCSNLYPKMLKSKTLCIKYLDPAWKNKEDYLCYIEPGIPLMKVAEYPNIRNGVRRRPTEKYAITGLSSTYSGCSKMNRSNDHTNNLYKIAEYEPWIRENSLDGFYCKY